MSDSVCFESLFESENQLKDEMPDEDVKEYVEKVKEKREQAQGTYGRDGSVEVFCQEFEYRGISFEVAVKRYFRISPLSIDAEIANDTNKWAVLRPADESEELKFLLEKFDLKIGFLDRVTTSTHNDGMSLYERFEECVETAESDIDWLKDDGSSKIDERIEELESVREVIYCED